MKRIATYFKNFANTYYTSITKYLFYDLVWDLVGLAAHVEGGAVTLHHRVILGLLDREGGSILYSEIQNRLLGKTTVRRIWQNGCLDFLSSSSFSNITQVNIALSDIWTNPITTAIFRYTVQWFVVYSPSYGRRRGGGLSILRVIYCIFFEHTHTVYFTADTQFSYSIQIKHCNTYKNTF